MQVNCTAPAGTAASQMSGWHIFPCHFIRDDGKCSCGKSDCNSPGKHPLTPRGLHDATNDAERIAKWWKVNPKANLAVATGEINQLVVIDIDADSGGFDSLLELEESHGWLPETLEAITGSGGRHFYYRLPPDVTINCRNGWRRGIDVKSEGGYVIAPPSVNGKGPYRWDEGMSPTEIAIAELPSWLAELLPHDGQASDAQKMRFTFGGEGDALLQRARAYVGKAQPTSEGVRNDTAFRLAGHLAAIDENGERLSEADIFDLVSKWNELNAPPLSDSELWNCVSSAIKNGTARPAKESKSAATSTPQQPLEQFTFAELQAAYPTLNPPVVDGLFRAGETVNIISTSKVGKSWLGYNLGLSVIIGKPWLERFATDRGRVLLVDNELHACTLANRIPAVANFLGIEPEQYAEQLEIWPLRGNLRSLPQLGLEFAAIEAGQFKLVILDAKYRFATPGVSENDNAAEAQFYNLIDQYAAKTGAAFILIHHSSKGSQSEKRITDVGAGAGAQSRAADCHIILREHEEPDVAVLEAAVRSFAPVEPLALRWEFPLWLPCDSADPKKLKGRLSARDEQQKENDRQGMDDIVAVLRKAPATASQLRKSAGMGPGRLERLIGLLFKADVIDSRKIEVRGNECDEYSLKP